MKITPLVDHIARDMAVAFVDRQLDEDNKAIDAFVEAYQEGSDPQVVATDKAEMILAYHEVNDLQRVETLYRDAKTHFLAYAEICPEPTLPAAPVPEPPKIMPLIVRPRWYHALPIWMWDMRDHEAEQRAAHEEVQRREARWNGQQKEYIARVTEAYQVALGIDGGDMEKQQ